MQSPSPNILNSHTQRVRRWFTSWEHCYSSMNPFSEPNMVVHDPSLTPLLGLHMPCLASPSIAHMVQRHTCRQNTHINTFFYLKHFKLHPRGIHRSIKNAHLDFSPRTKEQKNILEVLEFGIEGLRKGHCIDR